MTVQATRAACVAILNMTFATASAGLAPCAADSLPPVETDVLVVGGTAKGVAADTRDEKIAEGDCLVVIVNGAERRFVDKEPIKNGARYVGRIACPGPGDVVEVRIEDDDGHGKEGWMASGLMHIILGTAIKSSTERKEE